MQDIWYGDKPDLLKWSGAIWIARQYGIERILQVAYYKPTPVFRVCSMTTDDPVTGIIHVPDCVRRHFRDLRRISEMNSSTECSPIHIEVFTQEFTHRGRRQYTNNVRDRITAQGSSKLLVLLDPDTGIETPMRSEMAKHVTCEEIVTIWDALQPNSALAVFQHLEQRHLPNAVAGHFSLTVFADAIEPPNEVHTFSAVPPESSKAFLMFASKPDR